MKQKGRLLDKNVCLLANFPEMSKYLACLLSHFARSLSHFGVFRKQNACLLTPKA